MKTAGLGSPLLRLAVRYEADVVSARQKARRLTQMVGFDRQDQIRLATAVSELARNVYQYVGDGTVEFFMTDVVPQTLYIRVADAGPGIQDLDSILNGTYVSKSGMGVGLIGTKKLMDYFDVNSEVGQGTVVTIGKTVDKRRRKVEKEELTKLVAQFAQQNPDSPFEEIQNQNRDLLIALAEVRAGKEELAELNRELAETNRGVVALYAELDEKAASLQRANEVKTSFLSNMTHEFRTPLSSVISLTRLLLSRIDGELSAEQEKQVQYIRRSSEDLLELVNDLLDLAKVEAGKVSINPVDFEVEEVLGSLRGMFKPILNANVNVSLSAETDGPPFGLVTDQAKLAQILRNLVSNAIKFTESGSITVTAWLESNDIVHFAVADTGVGIEEKFLGSIFEDFSQIHSRLQAMQKGTGLGLPLSRKLARILGGDLFVESTVGKGSTFYVALPRVYRGTGEGLLVSHQGETSLEYVQERPSSDDAGKFRVLIIDDHEPSRYVLRNLINKELGATFSEAANGRIGLERIRAWRPDLVFLDLAMPEIDGFEVLRTLRRDVEFKDLPVIINTATPLGPKEKTWLDAETAATLSKAETDDRRVTADLREALRKAGFDYKRPNEQNP